MSPSGMVEIPPPSGEEKLGDMAALCAAMSQKVLYKDTFHGCLSRVERFLSAISVSMGFTDTGHSHLRPGATVVMKPRSAI